MGQRTTSKTVTFALPFLLKGVRSDIAGWRISRRYGRGTNRGTVLSSLPSRVDYDSVPTESRQAVEMLTVDPLDLQVAYDRDAAAHQTAEAGPLRKTGAIPGSGKQP